MLMLWLTLAESCYCYFSSATSHQSHQLKRSKTDCKREWVNSKQVWLYKGHDFFFSPPQKGLSLDAWRQGHGWLSRAFSILNLNEPDCCESITIFTSCFSAALICYSDHHCKTWGGGHMLCVGKVLTFSSQHLLVPDSECPFNAFAEAWGSWG